MSEKIKILDRTLLSDNWYVLHKYRLQYTKRSGETDIQHREVYDRGNGATILLYNRSQQSVVLIRQFRLPTFVNGNADGMLIETCAGLLDGDSPEDCIRREAEEETGYRIDAVRKVFSAYMSPGSVTELVHCFVGEYTAAQRISAGGGIEDEDIEILELPLSKALSMIDSGEIQDGKTIMLLQYAQLSGLLQA